MENTTKHIERSFGETVKKFFSLFQYRKIAYIKYGIKSLLEAINLVIHVLFLEKITHFLEIHNTEVFNTILVYYIVYILFFEITIFSIKKWGWMETIPMGISDVFNQYLPKYIKLDNNEVEAVGTGKLIGIIDKGAWEWVESLADVIEKGIALIIALFFTVYMVGKVEGIYAFIFIILIIVFSFLGKYSNMKLKSFRRVRHELYNERLQVLVKVLMSKIEILQNNKMDAECERTYEICVKMMNVNKKMSTHRMLLKRTSQFGMSLLLFVSFWYLGNSFLEGNIQLSVLVGLIGTLILMQKTIAESIGFYVDLSKKFVGIEKLWDFFDTTPEIEGYNVGKDFEYKSGEIEIKNMSFSYTEKIKIFDNFNLKIPGGKVIAFVGNSGSGKSTLVKIIGGYLTHNSGEVIIDGQKNKDISLKSLYKHIGYLTQEPSVFDGSIRENLMYGVDKVGNDCSRSLQQSSLQQRKKSVGTEYIHSGNLDRIISLAKCDFIYDFPNGLDTEIGEKGIRLSGGQRQRLAIAKIFLKNPEIIILDEPTSALDSFSEEQITIAMENLFKDRTVIIIAHRLQTVKNADKILVLENGKVVEEGTHTSLITDGGVYKKMLDLQSGF